MDDKFHRPSSQMSRVARLDLHLLGSLVIVLDGQPINGFRSDKERALLAYLSVETNRPHSRDSLAGLLWSETDNRTARNNLRLALHRLRQSLRDSGDGNDLIQADRGSIWIDPRACSCDASLFSSLLMPQADHRGHPLEDCQICQQQHARAVDLYHGDFLEGFFPEGCPGFDEWAENRREALHRLALQALHDLAEYHLRRGEAGQGLAFAQRQLALEPWSEESHRQAMRAYAREGQITQALVQYKICRKALADELGVEPAFETVDLYERILVAREMPRHNLPCQTTPFVGRQRELAAIASMLADPACRLLTIIGPGGIGKTRLVLQVAQNNTAKYLHGVCFVPLTRMASADLLVVTISNALGLTLQELLDSKKQLISYLHCKELLLVLDNFEHLVNRAGLLAEILKAAPDVKILVTSRERLKLQSEWTFDLQGLSDEPFDATDELAEAEQLFAQGARRILGKGVPGKEWPLKEDRDSISQICHLVEGSPLAIELAAAWTSSLSLKEIATEIRKGLDFLATSQNDVPERHRSVFLTFEHSWNLLSSDQCHFFSRLAVFQASFSASAAALVSGASRTTLNELVDKSLVRRHSNGNYDLHELLRQYAQQKLNEYQQEARQVHMAHCCYYADFLFQRQKALFGKGQSQALKEISVALQDVLAAWKWAAENGCVTELERSILSLSRFFEIRSHFKEGNEALSIAVAGLERNSAAGPRQSSLLSKTLAYQGWFAFRLHEYERARGLILRSLEAIPSQAVPADRAIPLCFLANVAYWSEDYSNAEKQFKESLRLFHKQGDRWWIAFTLICLANLAYDQQEFARARRFARKGTDIYRQVGDPRATTFSVLSLARISQALADYGQASCLYRECRAFFTEIQDNWARAFANVGLGVVALMVGEFEEAQKALHESAAIYREVDDPWGQATALTYLGNLAQARGDYLKAQEMLHQALEIHNAIQFQGGVALVLLYLARCSHILRSTEEAEIQIREALDTFQRIGDSHGIAHCKASLGELVRERAGVSAARDLFQESMVTFISLHDKWGIAYTHLCLGDLALGQGLFGEAEEGLKTSLRIFSEIGAKPQVVKGLVCLARLRAKQGKVDQARALLLSTMKQPAMLAETRQQAVGNLKALPKATMEGEDFFGFELYPLNQESVNGPAISPG